ncbi:MAG: VanZ family protein [Mucilaginibacter sp.]|nr:VanZ family protein [Mucilaginibacter sp.]
MKPTLKYYGPAILWALFVLIICAIPIGVKEGRGVFFVGFDKLTHCGLFFVLSVLYCAGSIRKWNTRNIRIEIAVKNTIVLLSYGALIELLQSKVFTWRSGDFNDLLCDLIGTCMGVFAVQVTGAAINSVK